jgi:hypothetical protein
VVCGFFIITAYALAHLRTALQHEARLAREDVLTSIPNLRSFHEDHARRAFRSAAGERKPVTLGLVDLSDIGYINDRWGTQAGRPPPEGGGPRAPGAPAPRRPPLPGRGDDLRRGPSRRFPDEEAQDYMERLRARMLTELERYDRPVSVAIAAVSAEKPSHGTGEELFEPDRLTPPDAQAGAHPPPLPGGERRLRGLKARTAPSWGEAAPPRTPRRTRSRSRSRLEPRPHPAAPAPGPVPTQASAPTPPPAPAKTAPRTGCPGGRFTFRSPRASGSGCPSRDQISIASSSGSGTGSASQWGIPSSPSLKEFRVSIQWRTPCGFEGVRGAPLEEGEPRLVGVLDIAVQRGEGLAPPELPCRSSKVASSPACSRAMAMMFRYAATQRRTAWK